LYSFRYIFKELFAFVGMKRRGLSQVVTTLLFVLLALGAVLLVWNLVRGIITEGGEDVSITSDKLLLSVTAKSAYVNELTEGVSVLIERGAGGGVIAGYNIIIEDESGASIVVRSDVSIDELETKRVSVSYAGSGLGKIAKVGVAPILERNGEEIAGDVISEVDVNEGNIDRTALSFSGQLADSHIDAGDDASLRLGTGDFAIAFWINPSDFDGITTPDGGQVRVLAKNGYPETWLVIDLQENGDDSNAQIQLEAIDGSGLPNSKGVVGSTVSDGRISLNEWSHVVVVYDRANKKARYYIDGVRDSEKNIPAGFNGDLDMVGFNFIIGGQWNPFEGMLDDLRVYKRALDDTDVASLYGNGAGDPLGSVGNGLVGWWKFDEGSGDVAVDSSGSGNDGVIKAGVEWVV